MSRPSKQTPQNKVVPQQTTKHHQDNYDDDEFDRDSPPQKQQHAQQQNQIAGKQQQKTSGLTHPDERKGSQQDLKQHQMSQMAEKHKQDFIQETQNMKHEGNQQKDVTKSKAVAVPNITDIQGSSWTNKHIIHKFMKRGFTALSAEELACTMVNPDYTIDFKQATGEDWSSSYQFKVVERLTKCKFNLQWATKLSSDGKYAPLFQIVKDGDISRLVEFFRAQASPHELITAVEHSSKKGALHIAAAEGHTQICEYLLGKGSSVESRDKLLRTPIHLACQGGHDTVVKLLLENNADPFDKDCSGRTALHYACCSGSVEQLTMLVDQEDLLHMKDHSGRSALHYTVFNPHPKCIEMALKLLSSGADVNVLDNDRKTPLHHASESGKARIIPVLLQRGASTSLREGLTHKTALELAPSDHIKELIIVNSAPPYIPKRNDLDSNLQIEGNTMKIQKEIVDPLGRDFKQTQKHKSINQKVKITPQKYEEEYKASHSQFSNTMLNQNTFGREQQMIMQPLGPYITDKTKPENLPYNIRNYQERMVMLLRRVQEFGVESYQHVKKPYIFTGSWMEHVRNLDDLMLQVNGVAPNEAVMKVFNILYPYDKPLPSGKGDELSLQGFYKDKNQAWDPVQDLKDCNPDVLREKLIREAEAEEKEVLKYNQVEEMKDLLKIKEELMTYQTLNGLNQMSIQEKDEKIKQLVLELAEASQQHRGHNFIDEQRQLELIKDNEEYQQHIRSLVQQLNEAQSVVESLSKQLEEAGGEPNASSKMTQQQFDKHKELEQKHAELTKQLDEEKEKNKAMRFKAGKIFLDSMNDPNQKDGGKQQKSKDGEIYLSDDAALMRFLIKHEQMGGTSIQQKLLDAGDHVKGTITKIQFINYLDSIGTTPQDILSMQRIAGFLDGQNTVKNQIQITDFMLKIKARAALRAKVEEETFQSLANEMKSKGLNIQSAFKYIDSDHSGYVTYQELAAAFKAMKIEIGRQDLHNIYQVLDANNDNQVSLDEFERRLEKYIENGVKVSQQLPKSNIIHKKEMQQLTDQLKSTEEKKDIKYDNFSVPQMAQDEIQKKEKLIQDNLANKKEQPLPINGELKIQFADGAHILELPGKATPFILLTTTQYTGNKENPKKEQTFRSPLLTNFRSSALFKWAGRIPFINQDINRISETILAQFYIQDNDKSQIDKTGALFIGECNIPWKNVVNTPETMVNFKAALSDVLKKCSQPVQGQVNIQLKFIPAGSEFSEYTADGQKKIANQKADAPISEEQKHSELGELELCMLQYTQNIPFDSKGPAAYIFQVIVGKQKYRSNAKQDIKNQIQEANGSVTPTYSILWFENKMAPITNLQQQQLLTMQVLRNSDQTVIVEKQIDLTKVYAVPNKFSVPLVYELEVIGTKPICKGLLKFKCQFKPNIAQNQNSSATNDAQQQHQDPRIRQSSPPGQGQQNVNLNQQNLQSPQKQGSNDPGSGRKDSPVSLKRYNQNDQIIEKQRQQQQQNPHQSQQQPNIRPQQQQQQQNNQMSRPGQQVPNQQQQQQMHQQNMGNSQQQQQHNIQQQDNPQIQQRMPQQQQQQNQQNQHQQQQNSQMQHSQNQPNEQNRMHQQQLGRPNQEEHQQQQNLPGIQQQHQQQNSQQQQMRNDQQQNRQQQQQHQEMQQQHQQPINQNQQIRSGQQKQPGQQIEHQQNQNQLHQNNQQNIQQQHRVQEQQPNQQRIQTPPNMRQQSREQPEGQQKQQERQLSPQQQHMQPGQQQHNNDQLRQQQEQHMGNQQHQVIGGQQQPVQQQNMMHEQHDQQQRPHTSAGPTQGKEHQFGDQNQAINQRQTSEGPSYQHQLNRDANQPDPNQQQQQHQQQQQQPAFQQQHSQMQQQHRPQSQEQHLQNQEIQTRNNPNQQHQQEEQKQQHHDQQQERPQMRQQTLQQHQPSSEQHPMQHQQQQRPNTQQMGPQNQMHEEEPHQQMNQQTRSTSSGQSQQHQQQTQHQPNLQQQHPGQQQQRHGVQQQPVNRQQTNGKVHNDVDEIKIGGNVKPDQSKFDEDFS